jgi:transcriptional regulator with XRE-family HTH domain
VKVRYQEYLIAFGENLKRIMEEKGMSPEDVAAQAELEPKQIYRVRNGEHSATLSVVYAIAKGLDVHPKHLFDFEYKEKKRQ